MTKTYMWNNHTRTSILVLLPNGDTNVKLINKNRKGKTSARDIKETKW